MSEPMQLALLSVSILRNKITKNIETVYSQEFPLAAEPIIDHFPDIRKMVLPTLRFIIVGLRLNRGRNASSIV